MFMALSYNSLVTQSSQVAANIILIFFQKLQAILILFCDRKGIFIFQVINVTFHFCDQLFLQSKNQAIKSSNRIEQSN